MKTPKWFMKRNWIAKALLSVSWLYLIVSKIVYKTRLFRAKSAKKPVICIGNILAGGVGKTPIVMEVAGRLKNSAVLTRGYGGKKTGRVLPIDTAREVGDEARMMAEHFDVFVGAKRQDNLPLMETYDYIIMDDGFQNPIVKKDVSILVFDGVVGIGNGFVLPAGPLRETLRSGLKRADAAIIIGEDETGLRDKISIPVFSAERVFEPAEFGKKIVAFSGLGYPEKFFASLEELSERAIKRLPFPDHHNWTKRELKKIFAMPGEIWTTEKDAARLPGWALEKVKILKMKAVIEEGFYKWLASKI
ncbi:MAG: tetraacyldisaccharide 4'-kinase [Rickettsiales bacterium]|jgi:tetraacyldisaccharide 4'-kinase|nr:tetraacyldisaccharide 4'-kinase [Rickettsiales bacterium]